MGSAVIFGIKGSYQYHWFIAVLGRLAAALSFADDIICGLRKEKIEVASDLESPQSWLRNR